jgi:hypothetical protein
MTEMKNIGIGNERTNKNGGKFFTAEIDVEQINKDWIYEKYDNFKKQNVKKMSIIISEKTSKDGSKKYWSVSQQPEYKKTEYKKPEQSGPDFNTQIDDSEIPF